MKNQYTITSKIILSMILFMTIGMESFGQDPAWKLTMEKGVEWTKYTPNKILLVGSSDWGLHGVDAVTGELLWSNEDLYNSAKALKGPDGKKLGYTADLIRVLVDEEHPEFSDFAVIKYTDNIAVKNFVVINIRTGELIINPKLAGMPVVKVIGPEIATFNYNGSDYIPQLGGVIITANFPDYTKAGSPENQITKFIDLKTGKIAWESSEISSAFLPVVTDDGNILMLGNKNAAKLESKTGKIIWTYEVADKKNNFEAFDADIKLTEGYFY